MKLLNTIKDKYTLLKKMGLKPSAPAFTVLFGKNWDCARKYIDSVSNHA